MIVCVCNQISDREIKRQVRAGMDFSDIQLELGVGTCCGCCEDCARDLVAQCTQAPDTPPPTRPLPSARTLLPA